MRIKCLIIVLFILSFLNCSRDEVETVDTEPEITITRCFTVKELGTDIEIEDARVALLGPIVCSAGCGPTVIGNKLTDSNGDVCFVLSERDNENILQIICIANGYHQFEVNSPELDFSEIYLEPN